MRVSTPLLALSLLLAGCGEDVPAVDTGADLGTCGDPDDSWVGVVSWMYFARRDEAGRTPGFDLDGVVSDGSDAAGCYKEDLLGPDGTPGIDSAFSGLLPALEATEASAIGGLIQDSILNGELLMLLELSALDDMQDDVCVDATLWRGAGVPLVGTDGELLDSQTFAVADQDPGHVAAAVLSDGAVDMGPFAFDLPLQVLDVELEFHLKNVWLHAELADDGSFHGYFAGAVPLDDIYVITAEGDLGATAELLESLVTLAADIDAVQEGACDGLSIVFEFTGKRAFLY